MKVQEPSFAHVGMEASQGSDLAVKVAQEEFATNLKSLLTSPELRAARQHPLPGEDIWLRQCELGELCWCSPDTCARLAEIPSRVNSLQGGDVFSY